MVSQRERILEVALDRFAHHGISATSIQDVADHADVSKANVLYHFGSKDQLVDQALEPALNAMASLVDTMETAGVREEEARRAFVPIFVDFLLEHRQATHVVVSHPYLSADIASLARAQQLMARMATAVSQQTVGDLDRLRFGVAVSGATYALVSSGQLGVEHLDTDTLRAGLRDVINSMLITQTSEVEN